LFGESLEGEILEVHDEKTFITSFLHLHGHDDSLIRKVALQIHEFSARWAFVPFEDVCPDLHTTLDICNLGAMTLFVKNVETLSPQHQNLLAEYIKSPRSLLEPLVLTSSNLSMESLSTRITTPTLLS